MATTEHILGMVTRLDQEPDRRCWGGSHMSAMHQTCISEAYHPSGLCATHRLQILGDRPHSDG